MTQFPESHRDLLQQPVAVLATEGTSPYPQVSALWFVLDGDTITLSLNTTRQKLKNLRQHPQCTLFLLDLANPHHTMEVRARAEIVPDTGWRVASMVQQKYGADVRQNDRPGEDRVAVLLHPVKINTYG